ncbi:MAG TPA: AMP-binding protein, partial [Acidimicrobiia bacterium]
MKLRPTYRTPRAPDYLRPGGPWDVPSLDVLCCDAARERGRRELLVDESAGVRWSGGELEAGVSALAGGLRAAGVGRRDVVAWQCPNWHEAVLLFRACWRLGAIAAPIHHQAGERDVARMLSIVEPKVWLSPHDVRGRHARFAELTTQVASVGHSAARPSDLAVVLFTAGSTGEPKAALHTQRGLAYKARVMVDAHRLRGRDAVLMPAPLSHISGLLNGVLLPGVLPFRSVLMPR